MRDEDIVDRIRRRFPRPEHADDGLLANEAANEIVRLRRLLALAHSKHAEIQHVLATLASDLRS